VDAAFMLYAFADYFLAYYGKQPKVVDISTVLPPEEA
jgi:hypothetical protein